MDTPSVPGDGHAKTAKAGTDTTRKRAAQSGAAKGGAAATTKHAVQSTAQGVRKGAAQAGGRVAALPGRVAGLARLMTLDRLLRAVPLAAAAAAGVVVGRLTARKP